MSNFSSIGVSVYEITHDYRVTWPFRVYRRSLVHTGHMKDAGEPAEPPGPLPPAMAAALAAFERYLRSERSLSPHTVRAYAGDVRSLLEHASRHGAAAPEGLGLTELRSWLAVQHESGAARATLARRGAAARTFTAFAHRRGWLATDPGPRLGTLKARRALPRVIRQDEMAAVLAGLEKAGRQAEAATAAAETSRAADAASHPGARRAARRARPAVRRTRASEPKPRWLFATPPYSSSSTRPGSGSANFAGWTRATSIMAAAPSGSGVRATRNAPCRSACPRCAR